MADNREGFITCFCGYSALSDTQQFLKFIPAHENQPDGQNDLQSDSRTVHDPRKSVLTDGSVYLNACTIFFGQEPYFRLLSEAIIS